MKYLSLIAICLTQMLSAAVKKNEAKKPAFDERGYQSLSTKAQPAFNAPAEIKVQDNWELFTTASFIYWLAEQDGLDLATSAALVEDQVVLPPVCKTLFQDFEFSPGFKIGLGIDTNYDDWLAGMEYTWFRQTTHTSSTADETPYGIGVWFMSNWFIQPTGAGQTLSATELKSKWNLQMDLLDGYLSRAFYQGRSLAIAPFVGLRAAWIKQSLKIEAEEPETQMWVSSHNKSNSWAIGPRLGLKGHWLLGRGFRLESDLAGSVLYTRYPSVKHEEDAIASNTIPVSAKFSNYGGLRSITECGLGLGWGMYVNRNKMAIDLLANYDFAIYWNQNMIRRVVDLNTLQVDGSSSNLYLQGLSLTLRLDY